MNEWSSYDTVEKVQKFIDENNVLNTRDLLNRFPGLHGRVYYKLKIHKNLHYPINIKDWSYYDTPEKIQKFIDDNGILSSRDLQAKAPGLRYRIYYILKISDKIHYPINIKDWSYYDTPEKIQKFIDDNDILNPSDLIKRFPGLHNRVYGILKVGDKLCYSNKNYVWRGFSVEDTQKFIDDNNIDNMSELGEKFPGLRNHIYDNKIQNLIVFKNKYIPVGERMIKEILENTYNLTENKDFVHDKTADFLTNKLSRLDFLIESAKLVIGYHGAQHFIETCFSKSDKTTLSERQNSDKIKYENCINAGYKVIYVSFPFLNKRYPEINYNSYFAKIITSKEELIKELNKYLLN